ncbi:tetratricopeptide repeat protein [Maribacter halichondriae]|uniref:tetratricopeptide repeat protein n=1 Tax=Maribacter halichondriae TaxID=2980554 RepID=UPI002358A120|nr:tetratricopeptide repeat protein [Maribacter sp. Hal144]
MEKEQLLYLYFSKELTAEQKQRFDELLVTDPDFKKQFDFESDIQNAIRDKETKDLKQRLVGFEKDISQSAPVRRLKPNYQKWSIAASITLLAALGWIVYNSLSGPNYNDLYESNFQEYPNTVYTITRSDTVQSLERDAFAAYESGDYELAAKIFLSSEDKGSIEHSNFYLAQTYLNLDKNRDAIALFNKVIETDDEFKAEANWYLALAYLKEEDKKNAIAVLEHHIENYDYNRSKAEELLKELD